MDFQEEAAFWYETCRRGIAFVTFDDGKVGIYKQPTPIDSRKDVREPFDETDTATNKRAFDSKNDAMDFLINFMEWNWTPPKPDASENIEELPVFRFKTVIMYDTGLGPESVTLHEDEFVTNCSEENWYEELRQKGIEAACKYLSERFPHKNLDKIRKDIRIVPSQLA